MTRRWQTPSALRRREFRAYGAMGRRADLQEARGGWVNMLYGRAYDRWHAARSHSVICRQFPDGAAYRLFCLDEARGEVEILQAAE